MLKRIILKCETQIITHGMTWSHGVSTLIDSSKLKSVSRIETTSKQGDLEDARVITAVLTYFRDNQVEQLFFLF